MDLTRSTTPCLSIFYLFRSFLITPLGRLFRLFLFIFILTDYMMSLLLVVVIIQHLLSLAPLIQILRLALRLVLAARREGIVQLARAPAAALLSAHGAALAVQVLRLVFVQEVEFPLVARVVAEALAARQVEVDAEADAEGEDEARGAVDPDLRLGGDAEGWEEGGQPAGAAGAGCCFFFGRG